MNAERWVIGANVVSDGAFRVGAHVWVVYVPGNQDQVEAIGLSKGGREIRKWIASKRLTKFRPHFVAPNLVLDAVTVFDSKQAAQAEIKRRFPPRVLTNG